MKRYLLFVLTLILLSTTTSFTQEDCVDGRYQEKIFQNYRRLNNVPVGRAITNYGVNQRLVYDVYLPPLRDENNKRAAVMLAHGGAYMNLIDQKSPEIIKLCEELALRGYVVFSVDYREENSFASLFSEKKMVLAVARSLIDIRNATCSIMDTTLNHGNPYGIDPNRVFVGGVSAGSISFLHAVFLDSIDWMPAQYRDWILEMEPNTQELLNNKYCGANLLGVLNVSGAVLDTAWIKSYKAAEYPPVMHCHGTEDNIVPYKHRHPIDIKELPKLFGSYFIDQRLKNIGVRSELDIWPGYGHAPVFGINPAGIFSGNLTNIIFNQKIFDYTVNHMVDFFFDLLECEAVVSKRDDKPELKLRAFPNPSTDRFYLDIPFEHLNNKVYISIFNVSGQEVYFNTYESRQGTVEIMHNLKNGLYMVNMIFENGKSTTSYSGKMMVTR